MLSVSEGKNRARHVRQHEPTTLLEQFLAAFKRTGFYGCETHSRLVIVEHRSESSVVV